MMFRSLFSVLSAVAVSLFCAASDAVTFACVQQDLSQQQLDHADYDVWQTMSRSGISRDGKWAMFSVQNGAIDGEATLTIRSLDSKKQYVIERGSGPQFTWDSKFALYRITPSKKKLKQLRKDKVKSDALPKAIFQILELESGELTSIENARSFQTPDKNGDWVACLLEKSKTDERLSTKTAQVNETYEVTVQGLKRPSKPLKLKKRESNKVSEPENEAAEKKKSSSNSKKNSNKKSQKSAESNSKNEATETGQKKDDSDRKAKKSGSPLMLINLNSGVQRTFPDVTSFQFSENGAAIAFATSVEMLDKNGSNAKQADASKAKTSKADAASIEPIDGVYVVELDSLSKFRIAEGEGHYQNLKFNEDGNQLAFISDKDDYDSKTSTWAVYHWKSKSKSAKKIATEGDTGIPAQWWIAPESTQLFSQDGKRLYFETAPIPESVLKQRNSDSEADADEDIAKLDVWHWQDPQLQPQQLLQAARERNRDYRAAFVFKKKKIVQLATLEIPNISLDPRRESNMALASTDLPYRKMMSWDVPGFRDAYLVNLDTGETKKVLDRVKWSAAMSPAGNFITWFDGEQQAWFAKSTSNIDGDPIEISKGIESPLYDELHDTPSIARAYGSAGWTQDDEAILIYDRFDIWKLDPAGDQEPVCITGGEGREKEIRFRYLRLDREERAIDPESPMMLSAFDLQTKASGYWELAELADSDSDSDPKDSESDKQAVQTELSQLIMLDESVGGFAKAQDSDRVIFTRSTFQMCPDLWHSNLSFKKIHRLSNMNPQQEDYSWGTAELVNWNSSDDQKLQGLLYKPAGFDPAKKYPLMVYFYERNSDNLHRYYAPSAGRSIINFSFYVSRGYLVFVPDIPYTTGEPGQSAANAILPGVESLVEKGFVDKEKIGMQGHSWGGYQTAYLVTQTDMFACAESGAPVSNMTSAYGGIRWSSGMSRMFQYERTQSRIGADLWSARDKYIRNSPVFFADKVNTPLLILHNDEDGAVPWYQGIEMFVALRRLEKPAWMLNYNGNPHWVMGDANRRDFAIRMQQFFDHYLLDAPEPEWMAVGVPAVNKGKEMGLELLEPVKSESMEEAKEEESVGEVSEKAADRP